MSMRLHAGLVRKSIRTAVMPDTGSKVRVWTSSTAEGPLNTQCAGESDRSVKHARFGVQQLVNHNHRDESV